MEQKVLKILYNSGERAPHKLSVFSKYLDKDYKSLEQILKAAINDTVRASTNGLTPLSIMASTAPFIGLFGTVVGILDAFSKLAVQRV